MKTSLTRISFHIVCMFRRPSRWRFFAAGIGREFGLWVAAIASTFRTFGFRKNSPDLLAQALA